MYRVVTSYRNGIDRPIIENGPWHPTRKSAEHWAALLEEAGYHVTIESQTGQIIDDPSGNGDLASALASMA